MRERRPASRARPAARRLAVLGRPRSAHAADRDRRRGRPNCAPSRQRRRAGRHARDRGGKARTLHRQSARHGADRSRRGPAARASRSTWWMPSRRRLARSCAEALPAIRSRSSCRPTCRWSAPTRNCCITCLINIFDNAARYSDPGGRRSRSPGGATRTASRCRSMDEGPGLRPAADVSRKLHADRRLGPEGRHRAWPGDRQGLRRRDGARGRGARSRRRTRRCASALHFPGDAGRRRAGGRDCPAMQKILVVDDEPQIRTPVARRPGCAPAMRWSRPRTRARRSTPLDIDKPDLVAARPRACPIGTGWSWSRPCSPAATSG